MIYRYCFSLPQDRFTDLSPEWYIAQNNNKFKKYKLKLPINSVIKTPIDVKVYYFCIKISINNHRFIIIFFREYFVQVKKMLKKVQHLMHVLNCIKLEH